MEALKQMITDILTPIIKDAVKEAWNHIHVSRATFYRLVGRGVIEILKIGNRSLVDADRLDEAVEKREIYRYKHW